MGKKTHTTSVFVLLVSLLFSSLLISCKPPVDESPSVTPPGSPGIPTVISGDGSLLLSWDAVDHAVSYDVWFAPDSDSEQLFIEELDALEIEITGLVNGQNYSVWIVAVNSGGKSAPGTKAQGMPLRIPDAPDSPSVDWGDSFLSLSWDAVDLAETYEVWVGTSDQSGDAELSADDLTELQYTVNGLTNGQIYYLWVRAENSKGVSDFSPYGSETPKMAIPNEPDQPSVSAGANKVDLSWTAVPGAETYEIWFGTTSSSDDATLFEGDITGTTLSISPLDNDTEYYFWLKAKNSTGTSGFSPSVSATPTLAIPERPTASSGFGDIQLTWSALSEVLGYELWYAQTDDADQAVQYGSTLTEESLLIEGLNIGTTYYFWLKGVYSQGTSGFSPSVSATPTLAIPERPTASSGYEYIQLTWPALSEALGYELWYAQTDDSDQAVQYGSTLTEESLLIEGLSNGTTYYFWLKAVYSKGTSDFSSSRSASAQAVAPAFSPEPEVFEGNSKVTLTWEPVPGASEYEVWYSTSSSSSYPAPLCFDAHVVSTECTVTDLDNGDLYFFWVKAKNSAGTSRVRSSGEMGWPEPEYDFSINDTDLLNGGSYHFEDTIPGFAETEGSIRFYKQQESLSQITSITLSGDDADQFELRDLSLPISFESSSFQYADIYFKPDSEGDKSAQLSIECDVPGADPMVIELTGTAIAVPGFAWGNMTVPGTMGGGDWTDISCSDDGQKVVAVDGDGYLYVSLNGGTSWEEKNSLGEFQWQNVEYAPDGSFFIAAAHGEDYIFVSHDDGESFIQRIISNDLSLHLFAISTDGTIIYAIPERVYQSSIYVSQDGGESWDTLEAAGQRKWYSICTSADGQVIAAGVSDGYMYISTDGGLTWREESSLGQQYWKGIDCSDSGDTIVALNSSDGPFLSTDTGATWTEQTSLDLSYSTFTDIAISADGNTLAACSEIIAAQGNAEIMVDTSIGTGGWTHTYDYEGVIHWTGLTMSSDGSDLFAVGTDSFIQSSSDSGDNWTTHTEAGTRGWTSLDTSSDGQTIVGTLNNGYVLYSSDGGLNWSEYFSGSGYDNYDRIVCSDDGQKILASEGTGKILRSSTGGSSWSTFTGSLYWWTGIALSGDGSVAYAIENDGTMYRSVNTGSSWSSLGSVASSGVTDIDCSTDGSVIILCNSDRIYFSSDGGVNWDYQYFSSAWLDRVTLSGDGTTMVGIASYGDVYLSTDGGVNWDTVDTLGRKTWTDCAISEDGNIIAVSSDSNDTDPSYIYVSIDEGDTWTTQWNAGSLDWNAVSVSADGSQIYAAGDSCPDLIVSE